MRDRKTIIYLNVKDLTPEEIEKLGDMDLSTCDNCGEIDMSTKLRWIDSEEFWEDPFCVVLVGSGMCAVCDDCYDKRNKIAHCGSCEKYFVDHKDGDMDCPHCGSANWVHGCIDDAHPDCFNCQGKLDCSLEAYQDCQYNPANKRVETAEDVIKVMRTDLGYYQEWLEGLAIKALKQDQKNLQSWKDWFNKEGEFPES